MSRPSLLTVPRVPPATALLIGGAWRPSSSRSRFCRQAWTPGDPHCRCADRFSRLPPPTGWAPPPRPRCRVHDHDRRPQLAVGGADRGRDGVAVGVPPPTRGASTGDWRDADMRATDPLRVPALLMAIMITALSAPACQRYDRHRHIQCAGHPRRAAPHPRLAAGDYAGGANCRQRAADRSSTCSPTSSTPSSFRRLSSSPAVCRGVPCPISAWLPSRRRRRGARCWPMPRR